MKILQILLRVTARFHVAMFSGTLLIKRGRTDRRTECYSHVFATSHSEDRKNEIYSTAVSTVNISSHRIYGSPCTNAFSLFRRYTARLSYMKPESAGTSRVRCSAEVKDKRDTL